jgi:chemotaxis protein methyltransferase CheR
VWHAGCARGEEAYTSAILFDEEGLGDRTQIYATDLSPRAIEHAKEGVYPIRDLATLAKNHEASGKTSPLTTWLTSAYEQIAMREALRKKILFFQHDLATDHVFGEMHLVFCRNVLIYFRAELREQVLQKLAASLCPGGFLCLGTSERLSDVSPLERSFKPFSEAERIYRYDP